MRHDRINLARYWLGGRGFTLIEILIVVVILGVLGAVVLPRFSDASNTTRENTLKDDLRYARTQMIVSNGSSMPPAAQPDNSTGWIYKPQTLELIPNSPGNDSEGTPYVEY